MYGTKDALLRLVRAWIRTDKAIESYLKAEIKSNLLIRANGEIQEAISILVGEADVDLEDSVTNTALTAQFLTDERRVELLMAAYRKNVEHKTSNGMDMKFRVVDMETMVRKNGGYSASIGYVPPKTGEETPEGEWK